MAPTQSSADFADATNSNDPLAPSAARRLDIEAVRVLSAFGIVWYHADAPAHQFAYSGLVIFLILGIMLGARSGGANWQSTLKRARRLLVPWAAWCIVYAVFNLSRGRPPIPLENLGVLGLLAGPSQHLWFMPFLFLCLISIDHLRAHTSLETAARLGGGIAIAMIATFALWRAPSMQLALPLPQWLHALPAIGCGIFLCFGHTLKPTEQLTFAAALLLALGALLADSSMECAPYFLGVVVCTLLMRWQYRHSFLEHFREVASATLGIYFVHILVMAALRKLGFLDASLALLTFWVSAGLVIAFKRLFPSAARYLT